MLQDRNKETEEGKRTIFIHVWTSQTFLVFPYAFGCLFPHYLGDGTCLHFPDEETIGEKRVSCSYCKGKS